LRGRKGIKGKMYLDKQGYRKLITWQKANELRKLVYTIAKVI